MGYAHIDNLYRNQEILMFRECWAMEKVHGTSAHISFRDGALHFSPGGCKLEHFKACFPDHAALLEKFQAIGIPHITVFGEAYGGRMQGMKATYGDALCFIAFDVKMGEHTWLSVPDMAQVATDLGLEAVPYRKIPTDLAAIDAERDRPSEVAERRGCGTDRKREGVVLRPLIELRKNNNERICAKHKRDDYQERVTPQKIVDPAQLQVLADAEAIANEWVTEMRLTHVLDKLEAGGVPLEFEATPKVIVAMIEDVEREAKGEIVVSKEARKAIGNKTRSMFHARLKAL